MRDKSRKPSVNPPTPESTYERARRLANLAVWTVALQKRRLKTDEPEDEEFLFRRWADFQFLIVALMRLRRAAILAAEVPNLKVVMQKAIKDFDATLPMLNTMRNTAEHIDDYALDRGRNTSVKRSALEVGMISDSIFEWLDHRLDTKVALAAAHGLFEEIQKSKSLLMFKESPHDGER